MHNSSSKISSRIKFVRKSLIGLFLLLGTIVVAAPASAATGSMPHADAAALAMVIAFGSLLFAIVFQVWHMTLTRSAPIHSVWHDPADPRDQDR